MGKFLPISPKTGVFQKYRLEAAARCKRHQGPLLGNGPNFAKPAFCAKPTLAANVMDGSVGPIAPPNEVKMMQMLRRFRGPLRALLNLKLGKA